MDLMSLVIVLLWAGYLAWFTVVLVKRLKLLRAQPRAGVGELGLDIFLLPALLILTNPSGELWQAFGAFVAPGIALALWTFAPRYVSSKALPLALVAAGLQGFVLIRDYSRSWWIVPQRYGLVNVGFYLRSEWTGELLLLQACAFVAVGLWLTWRRLDPQSWVSQRVLRVPARFQAERSRPRWGLLLLPLVGMLVELLGRTYWFGVPSWSESLTVAVCLAAAVIVIRFPAVAADLAIAGLILFGIYGVALAAGWPNHIPLPSPYTTDVRYGAIWVAGSASALAAGAQGLAFIALGAWLFPRAIDDRTRSLLRSGADIELAQRVGRLTRSRADAVDSATTQLRQLERDLHDGAQARLVALGMSLRAAERLIPNNPDAAVALVAEARETSLKVLDELRDLVRGICPPVLADRGLGDAIRALALDTPLRTEVDIDLPSRPELPVESACYFAVAEALANAVKHSGARSVHIRVGHADSTLRIAVIDDGVGGADPQRGTGLLGLERRLGAFDGVLAVSSPAGGPTIVAIEVPCELRVPVRLG